MISNEMADNLELLLDRSFTNGSPGYEDFELSQFLTDGQNYFVKQQLSRFNNRKGQSFEETEARSQSISELIKPFQCPQSSDQTGVLKNGVFFDLPEDFMYTIYEECEVNVNGCDGEPRVIDVKDVSHQEYRRLVRNKYKRPKLNGLEPLVWRMQFSRHVDNSSGTPSNRRHQIITGDNFYPTGYRINYLMNPVDIVVDRSTPANQVSCLLNKSSQLMIIDIARDLAMGTLKEQKVNNIAPVNTLE